MIKNRIITGLMILGVAGMLGVGIWGEFNQGPPDFTCGERIDMSLMLRLDHDMKPVANFDHRGASLDLFVAEDNTFALLWTEPSGSGRKESARAKSCVVASGIDWTMAPS